MYTLRIITEGVENNYFLGNHYQVIAKSNSPKAFEDILNDHFEGYKGDLDSCWGFVFATKLEDYRPLYLNDQTYIMGEKGNTFSNLTRERIN